MACRPRLYFDTNVLVSAVLFGGVPGRLVDAARSGRAEGVVSLHVLLEFVDVLTRPRFGVDEATSVALAEEIAEFMEVVLDGRVRDVGPVEALRALEEKS